MMRIPRAVMTISKFPNLLANLSKISAASIRSINIDKKLPRIGTDGFEVLLNVKLYSPNELTVKLIEDKLVVEGKHDIQEDSNSFISQAFIREFVIPEACDLDKITSTLSSDGCLRIQAPLQKNIPDEADERIINIEKIQPPKN